jgi:hypothetical protein
VREQLTALIEAMLATPGERAADFRVSHRFSLTPMYVVELEVQTGPTYVRYAVRSPDGYQPFQTAAEAVDDFLNRIKG